MLLCQCSFGASATEKAEAGRISRAVDRLRDAPNAQKSQLLAALESASCAAADLCELQRLCLVGYRQHIAALDETARASELLSRGDREGAAQALDHAGRGVTQAAAKIARCTDAQGAAHRKYKF